MKSKKRVNALMIIGACLVIVFVILLLVIINTVGREKVVSNEISSLEFYIRRGNYDEVHDIVKRNRKRNIKKGSEYKMYEAVSDYYDNAFRYKVHLVSGDGNEAQYFEAMEDAKSRMGDFSFAADDINAIVNW